MILVGLLISTGVWAEDASDDIVINPELVISAINAGYTDGETKQNYDFVEIYNTTGEPVSLDEVRIEYINSTGSLAGNVAWAKGVTLNAEYLVLGYAKSPQYESARKEYLYNFGSAGIASTAGYLRLSYREKVIDEVCWGSATCAQNLYKFHTSKELNMTMRRCVVDGLLEGCANGTNFEPANYYPDINEGALMTPVVEEALPQCKGLEFTEIYSYFETDYSEQFIELTNNSGEVIALDGCRLKYKNKEYRLLGELYPGEFFAYQNPDLKLTKNPSSSNEIVVVDADGSIATSVSYYYGQKRGTSFAWFENDWKQTYAPSPGEENVWQEFRTCVAGKIINPQTGNCINFYEDAEPLPCPVGKYRNPETNRCRSYENIDNILRPCAEGYYRSPDTNRCRKVASVVSEIKPCADGYERNPETNRCRKIRVNNGADYGVKGGEELSGVGWVGYGAMAAVVGIGVGYVGWQFRDEIKRGMMKLVRGKRKS